jgi:sugar phosphate isomerase/epimerase
MAEKFSLAHLTLLHCTPPELVDIASETGYDFVSLRMTPVTTSEQSFPLFADKDMLRRTKDRLTATGMKVLDVELARFDPATDPESFDNFLEAAAELGAQAVITQLPDPNRQRAAERFARFCDMAKPFQLTVDLEFPSWTETSDLHSAMSILKIAAKSNAGLLVDTLHFARSGSSLTELQKTPRSLFHFIHLCDAPKEIPTTTEGLIHTARAARNFPGEGELDLREILAAMPPVPYSLEIPNDRLENVYGAKEYARRALVAAKKLFEDQG